MAQFGVFLSFGSLCFDKQLEVISYHIDAYLCLVHEIKHFILTGETSDDYECVFQAY